MELTDGAAVLREAAANFWAKVATDGDCWTWRAGISGSGYGRYWHNGRFVQAHRFSYEQMVGPIPDGLVIDHLCRVRPCVRPDHLEPVPQRENARRGDKGRRVIRCKNGHDYTPANTYIKPNGCRGCRTCRNAAKRRSYWAARALLGRTP